MATVQELQKWFKLRYNLTINQRWIEQHLPKSAPSAGMRTQVAKRCQDELFAKLLVSDLKYIVTAGSLPHDIGPTGAGKTKVILPDSLYCLQVESFVDIGTSAYSQYRQLVGYDDTNLLLTEEYQQHKGPAMGKDGKSRSGNNRMLWMKVTDGRQTLLAMEYMPIPQLTLEAAPGLKVLIQANDKTGGLKCRRGVVMLTSHNTRVLGGHVTQISDINTQINLLSAKLDINIEENDARASDANNNTDDGVDPQRPGNAVELEQAVGLIRTGDDVGIENPTVPSHNDDGFSDELGFDDDDDLLMLAALESDGTGPRVTSGTDQQGDDEDWDLVAQHMTFIDQQQREDNMPVSGPSNVQESEGRQFSVAPNSKQTESRSQDKKFVSASNVTRHTTSSNPSPVHQHLFSTPNSTAHLTPKLTMSAPASTDAAPRTALAKVKPIFTTPKPTSLSAAPRSSGSSSTWPAEVQQAVTAPRSSDSPSLNLSAKRKLSGGDVGVRSDKRAFVAPFKQSGPAAEGGLTVSGSLSAAARVKDQTPAGESSRVVAAGENWDLSQLINSLPLTDTKTIRVGCFIQQLVGRLRVTPAGCSGQKEWLLHAVLTDDGTRKLECRISHELISKLARGLHPNDMKVMKRLSKCATDHMSSADLQAKEEITQKVTSCREALIDLCGVFVLSCCGTEVTVLDFLPPSPDCQGADFEKLQENFRDIRKQQNLGY